MITGISVWVKVLFWIFKENSYHDQNGRWHTIWHALKSSWIWLFWLRKFLLYPILRTGSFLDPKSTLELSPNLFISFFRKLYLMIGINVLLNVTVFDIQEKSLAQSILYFVGQNQHLLKFPLNLFITFFWNRNWWQALKSGKIDYLDF